MAATTVWNRAQAASDGIFAVVKPSAIYARPVPERHRLIFYLGHLEAFDWNLLAPALGLKSFRPDWDRLFAFGIDPVDGVLPHDQPKDWPERHEIESYNREVRDRLQAGLQRPHAAAISSRLTVAREHRWMHVETLCYLLHNLDYAQKSSGPAPAGPGAAPPPKLAPVRIPAGEVTLGRPRGDGFGWDNEFAEHRVSVPAFEADRTKVTNGAYLEFVQAGADVPQFWRRSDGGWTYRGMFAETPLPLDHPVYVTWEQSAAYAAWRGKKLPSEAQWQRMAYGTPEGVERAQPWGAEAPADGHGNFGLRHWDPVPVGAHPAGASAWGVDGLVGNGWEWTSTVFGPFPGFEALPFYPGYSANFFDGAHYVLKGASARTEPSLIRRSFRNWFQPHYPYLYAGFRCICD